MCGCQWGCSHGVISCVCDALVCVMLHMIRFHTHSVWFQCKFIGNRIQTLRTLWTKSLNRKQHFIFWYNKLQSHIAPCEWALKLNIEFKMWTLVYLKIVAFVWPNLFFWTKNVNGSDFGLTYGSNCLQLLIFDVSKQKALYNFIHSITMHLFLFLTPRWLPLIFNTSTLNLIKENTTVFAFMIIYKSSMEETVTVIYSAHTALQNNMVNCNYWIN